MPTYVQQLQFTVKNPTVGKAATFTKVDNVIQETKNLMNVISKVVTTCFVCATKVRYVDHVFCFNPHNTGKKRCRCRIQYFLSISQFCLLFRIFHFLRFFFFPSFLFFFFIFLARKAELFSLLLFCCFLKSRFINDHAGRVT